jgi:hypothetical protein
MHNAAMIRWIKLLALLMLVLLAMGFVALVGLQYWLGTADFRARVQARVSEAAGVEVVFDRLVVDPWPTPGVAALGIRLQTAAPIVAHRVEVRPAWPALLRGRLALSSLVVEGAEVPQAGVDEWMERRRRQQAPQRPGADPGPSADLLAMLPRRVVVDRLRWLRKGAEPLALDARLLLDPSDHAPQILELKVIEGAWRDARLQLDRRGAQTWDLKANLAGGTVQGPVQVERVATGWQLKGTLATAGVELGKLGSGRLSGKLEAGTTVQAQAPALGALVEVLQTQSRFTVRDAVVQGLDLARAVKTVGMSRGGQTPLDTLAGLVTTRGSAVALNNLVANSGVLAATGNVTVAAGNRALAGRIVVRLGSGLVGEVAGVPLVLGGTLDNPELSLTRGAAIGAAMGTLVMPGVGTGAGANLGDRIGDKIKGLFGN